MTGATESSPFSFYKDPSGVISFVPPLANLAGHRGLGETAEALGPLSGDPAAPPPRLHLGYEAQDPLAHVLHILGVYHPPPFYFSVLTVSHYTDFIRC